MKKIALYITVLLSLFFVAPVNAQIFFPDLKTANQAYSEKDYPHALKHWENLASRNNDKAFLGLGRLYSRGLGVQQNHKTALTYFMKAAEQNNAKAQYEIAYAYEKGRGVSKDLHKSENWYTMSANNGYKRAYKRLSAINKEYQPPSNLSASKKQNYRIITTLKSQFISEENTSLGTKNDSATSFVLNGKVTARYDSIQDIRLQTQIRVVHSTGSAQSNYDDDDQAADSNFIEMRQAWIEFKNLFDINPLSLKVGRQRFREDRGNWWDRDMDAIRLSFDTTLTSGFVSFGQNLGKHRIGSVYKLEQDEENRFRLLGETSHKLANNHKISGRFLFEHDYSDLEDIGQNISSDDRDDNDYSLLWTGLRAQGPLLTSPKSKLIDGLRYRADLMSVIGEEETISTSSGPSLDLRTVNAHQKRDVRGWAFDGSVETKIKHWLNPVITLGYAFGSGDDGQGTNTTFRQTGLEGNTSYYPEGRVASPLRNHGEVLRPELSNIHILNLGLNIPFLTASDFNFNYYSYWRANQKSDVPSNGIDASLSASGHNIGQAIDLAAHINLSEEMKLTSPLMQRTNLRLKLGSFYSGEAYGSAKDELSYKGTAEVSVKF
jgi:alginate production protein